jgi:hypothetical protein
MREDIASEAQSIVRNLLDSGKTAEQISKDLDGRVSPRTIYRWRNGESSPQQPSDLEALRRLQKKEVSHEAVPDDGDEQHQEGR